MYLINAIMLISFKAFNRVLFVSYISVKIVLIIELGHYAMLLRLDVGCIRLKLGSVPQLHPSYFCRNPSQLFLRLRHGQIRPETSPGFFANYRRFCLYLCRTFDRIRSLDPYFIVNHRYYFKVYLNNTVRIWI